MKILPMGTELLVVDGRMDTDWHIWRS